MTNSELLGFPQLHPDRINGIDKQGRGCRIGAGVTVFRAINQFPNAGIILGDEVVLFDNVRLLLGESDTQLNIADRVIVNVGAYLSGEGGLSIDDDVMIGPHACLLSAGHGIHGGHAVVARNEITEGRISIGRGAWIGARAVVLQGVEIGDGAVVGAGAVVTRSVPPFAVVAGNPARLLHYREGHVGAANLSRRIREKLDSLFGKRV
jgi:acetyltransferase-like isoleucine patch superfamily enzyme